MLIALGFFVIAGILLYFAFAPPAGNPLEITGQTGVTYYAGAVAESTAVSSGSSGNTAQPPRHTDTPVPAGKVHLNTATFEQLLQVPGIGEVKAAAIIAYRTQVALFQSVDDLKNIQGFGDKTVEKLRDHVTV